MGKVTEIHITGDEWWLKPEQGPNETREQWKSRTFSMRYGRSLTVEEFTEALGNLRKWKKLMGEETDEKHT